METKKINKKSKYACACCGYYTLEGISEICSVCFWQKDNYQEENLNDDGGPNTVSLRIARENFKKFGVIEEHFKDYVRPPQEDELP